MSTATQPKTTNLAELKQTSKMVAADAGMGAVKRFFDSQKNTLASVLPKHVSPDRMLKIALGALRTTPKLTQCTVESLMGAVVQCSQLGLEPNTPLGHAYLIPFDKKKKQGTQWVVEKTEVQIVLGYKGLIDLARRSGQVVSIAAHEVCSNDHFEYSYGLDEKLEHRPALGDRGDVIAFYSVAKLKDGGHAFEVMSRAQVEEIRDASQNYKFAKDKNSTVWGAHFIEMGRKTVLRRLFKYLPVSIELATASALDGMSARGVSQGLDANTLDGEFTIVPEDAPVLTDETVDEQTGEVQQSGQAVKAEEQASQTDQQPAKNEEQHLSFAKVADSLNHAKDTDVLDVAADLISEVADEQQKAELVELYKARKEALLNPPKPAKKASGMSVD